MKIRDYITQPIKEERVEEIKEVKKDINVYKINCSFKFNKNYYDEHQDRFLIDLLKYVLSFANLEEKAKIINILKEVIHEHFSKC